MASTPFQLAGFEPIQRLGGGGFGEVWLARQTNIDRMVAVKVGHVPIDDKTVQLRFERECIALGRLSGHRNIIDVFTAGQLHDGRPYLVLEYVSGGTLWQRVHQNPLTEAELMRIGTQLADALAIAHEAGVLHRDLKPENVLLRPNSEVVLGDFGIARLHDGANTTSQAIAASVAYAAPEILAGKPATIAADVYGLGICFLAAILRSVPFVEDTDESIHPIINRVLSNDPPDLRNYGISDGFARLIEQLLAKDPSQRPDSAAEVKRRLDELSSGSTSTRAALPSPPGEPSANATRAVGPPPSVGGLPPPPTPSNPSVTPTPPPAPPFHQGSPPAPPPQIHQVSPATPPPFHQGSPPAPPPQIHQVSPATPPPFHQGSPPAPPPHIHQVSPAAPPPHIHQVSPAAPPPGSPGAYTVSGHNAFTSTGGGGGSASGSRIGMFAAAFGVTLLVGGLVLYGIIRASSDETGTTTTETTSTSTADTVSTSSATLATTSSSETTSTTVQSVPLTLPLTLADLPAAFGEAPEVSVDTIGPASPQFCDNTPLTAGLVDFVGETIADSAVTSPLLFQEVVRFETDGQASAYVASFLATVNCDEWTQPESADGPAVLFRPEISTAPAVYGDDTREVVFEASSADGTTTDVLLGRVAIVRKGTDVYTLNVTSFQQSDIDLLDGLLQLAVQKLGY